MSNDTTVKKCCKCLIEKELACFSKDKTSSDGFQYVCKSCRKEYMDKYNPKYYIEHKDDLIEYQNIYRIENKDKVSKTQHANYIKNRDKILAGVNAYRNANKEIISTKKTEYKRRNKDKVRQHAHKRRANKANVGGTHTAQEMVEQFDRQKKRCYWCNTKLINPFTKKGKGEIAHWDHIIPLKKGGRNDLSNLVWACKDCNLSKGAKLPSEWKGSNGKLL